MLKLVFIDLVTLFCAASACFVGVYLFPETEPLFIGLAASHFLIAIAQRESTLPYFLLLASYALLITFVCLLSQIKQQVLLAFSLAFLVGVGSYLGHRLAPYKILIAYTLVAVLFSSMTVNTQSVVPLFTFMLALVSGIPSVLLLSFLRERNKPNAIKNTPDRKRSALVIGGIAFILTLVLAWVVGILELPYMLWWVIGVVSFVITSSEKHQQKLKDRVFGVCLGSCLGLLLSSFIPLLDQYKEWVVVLIFATLLIQHYRLAYTMRCTLLLWFVLQTIPSFEVLGLRITAVVFSGLLVVLVVSMVAKYSSKFDLP